MATGLWPVLADLGFYDKTLLKQFGKVGSPLNDHPNMKLAPGIDFSSGSLGHNLVVGTGMALAGRLSGRDYRTFVLTGDGELQEGQVWEAAMAASHYKLGNLVAIVDANGFSGVRPDLAGDEHRAARQRGSRPSAGGSRRSTGTTSPRSGRRSTSLPDAATGEQPVAIIARTRKGHGVEFMEKQPQAWHLGLLTPEQHADVVAEITARMELTMAAGPKGARSEPVARADREEDGRRLLRHRRDTALKANPSGYAVTEIAAGDDRDR